MVLAFDKHGHLTPNHCIEIETSVFGQFFVEAFSNSQTRTNLFENWYIYNQNLKRILQVSSLTQWINGSFVTSKQNPKDIDFVTFIPFLLFEQYEKELEDFWSFALEDKGLDAYLVKQYMPETLFFDDYLSIKALWTKRFIDGRNHAMQKGFIELVI